FGEPVPPVPASPMEPASPVAPASPPVPPVADVPPLPPLPPVVPVVPFAGSSSPPQAAASVKPSTNGHSRCCMVSSLLWGVGEYPRTWPLSYICQSLTGTTGAGAGQPGRGGTKMPHRCIEELRPSKRSDSPRVAPPRAPVDLRFRSRDSHTAENCPLDTVPRSTRAERPSLPDGPTS